MVYGKIFNQTASFTLLDTVDNKFAVIMALWQQLEDEGFGDLNACDA